MRTYTVWISNGEALRNILECTDDIIMIPYLSEAQAFEILKVVTTRGLIGIIQLEPDLEGDDE